MAKTDYEIEQEYKNMLDETYGTVKIAGFDYETSYALKECDPIAYQVGLSDYEASIEEEGECDTCGDSYDTSDSTNRCGECGNCETCCTHKEGE